MDYRESIRHGDERLAVAVYDITPQHPRYHMHAHWHPELEILHVRRGRLRLLLSDVSYDLSAGDVMVLPGGAIHSGEPEECSYTCVLVNLRQLPGLGNDCIDLCRQILDGSLQLNCHPATGGVQARLCQQMLEFSLEKGPGYPFTIQGLIFCFFGRMLDTGLFTRIHREKRPAGSLADRIRPAIAYIEQNYNRNIRVADLAAQTGLSQNYFCRCFRLATGSVPLDYLTNYRMTKAKYALCNTNLSVTDVAMECGYNEASHFIRIFHKYVGMTPLQFRRTALREG